MRYTGNRQVVEDIENEIKSKAKWFERPKADRVDQFQLNVLRAKTLDIMTIRELFPITFLYDGRDSSALIDIRDRDLGWLCKLSPKILKLLAQLDPYLNHSRYR